MILVYIHMQGTHWGHKNDTGPLSQMQIQYGTQHGHQHLHIFNCSLKFDDLCVYSQFFGDNERI